MRARVGKDKSSEWKLFALILKCQVSYLINLQGLLVDSPNPGLAYINISDRRSANAKSEEKWKDCILEIAFISRLTLVSIICWASGS